MIYLFLNSYFVSVSVDVIANTDLLKKLRTIQYAAMVDYFRQKVNNIKSILEK